MDVEIRPLNAADAVAFRALRLRAVADAPSAVGPSHDEEAAHTDADNAARIRRTDTQVVFGAFAGTALVGIAGLRREPLRQLRHKAVVWGVFVAPEQRGAGLARRLLDTVVAHARGEGLVQLHLCENANNERAQKLYRSLGFVRYGVEPRAIRIGERYYDEEHMALRLDDA